MKKYIRSDNSINEVNLTDLFNGFYMILVVPDARTYKDGSVMASTYFDFSNLPDDELMKLDNEDMHEIADVDTLQRIMSINPDRLEDWQKSLVTTELRAKVIMDQQDVENVLSDLKKCDKIKVEITGKNRMFDSMFHMTDDEKLDIIHSMDIGDFVNITKSVNTRHLGNQLIVFMPEVDLVTDSGVFMKDVYLYVKVDLTTVSADNRALAVVSFHPAEIQSAPRPYHTDEHDDDEHDAEKSEDN